MGYAGNTEPSFIIPSVIATKDPKTVRSHRHFNAGRGFPPPPRMCARWRALACRGHSSRRALLCRHGKTGRACRTWTFGSAMKRWHAPTNTVRSGPTYRSAHMHTHMHTLEPAPPTLAGSCTAHVSCAARRDALLLLTHPRAPGACPLQRSTTRFGTASWRTGTRWSATGSAVCSATCGATRRCVAAAAAGRFIVDTAFYCRQSALRLHPKAKPRRVMVS